MKSLQQTLKVFLLLYIATTGIQAHEVNLKISDIFVPDMLGADLAYLEYKIGPARNTTQLKKRTEKIYKIDSCLLTVSIYKGTIFSLKAHLTDKCTFDLNKFIDNAPSANLLTFGKFDDLTGGYGLFTCDCFGYCGNFKNSVIYEILRGPKSQNWRDIMIEAKKVTSSVIDASKKWSDHMEKEEESDWVTYDMNFNCTRTKYDAFAHKVFRDVKIDAITIGYEVAIQWCEDHGKKVDF